MLISPLKIVSVFISVFFKNLLNYVEAKACVEITQLYECLPKDLCHPKSSTIDQPAELKRPVWIQDSLPDSALPIT